jgi:[ribosomal protein S18]-alanine N-acetyltransferase
LSRRGTDVLFRVVDRPEPRIIERIAALEHEAFGRGGLNEWHLPVVARQGRLYVLESGDELLAAAGLISSWRENSVYLIDFAVAAGRRRLGFGRLLLEKMIDDLKKEGAGRLALTVAPDNEAAISLYRSLGFKRADEYIDEYGSGRDRWLLELTL